jgi:uncharacterized membrane protein
MIMAMVLFSGISGVISVAMALDSEGTELRVAYAVIAMLLFGNVIEYGAML